MPRLPRGLELAIEEEEEEQNYNNVGWKWLDNGDIYHPGSGTRISDKGILLEPEKGLVGRDCEGSKYLLSPGALEIHTDVRLGRGVNGTVFRGTIKATRTPCAIKTMQVQGKDNLAMILNELIALVNFEPCPYIVTMFAGFRSPKNDAVKLVLELMDLGSLSDLLARLGGEGVPARYLECITVQALLGIQHLHRKDFLHRDIKPANVLANRAGEIKITDFGISTILSDRGDASVHHTTLKYMAPERFSQDEDARCSLPSDIWSVGLMVHELACGVHPYEEVQKSGFIALMAAVEGQPPELPNDCGTQALRDFLPLCLATDEAQRMDVGDLLRHDFTAQCVSELAAAQVELGVWLGESAGADIGGELKSSDSLQDAAGSDLVLVGMRAALHLEIMAAEKREDTPKATARVDGPKQGKVSGRSPGSSWPCDARGACSLQ